MIYETIEKLGIQFTRVENDPGITMEDCLNIDKALDMQTVKTILLTNRQKTMFYLYITPGDKPFVTRDFSNAMGISRVSFAPEELMIELLGTGHGSATLLSVIADTDCKVNVVIDGKVADSEWFGCTDGDARGFFKLRTSDVLNHYLPATNHTHTVIN
ncbi:MAG: prolyl-tRNA synthetase associated domain-containing protein, partial [Muribaculaceae bacterium]|nr:prolyl-tRNA synthetase associated domain-containing protein [Muribaculaceae bacterium]